MNGELYNSLPIPFYINYEECKFLFELLMFDEDICFILTMRNVNIVCEDYIDMSDLVLY